MLEDEKCGQKKKKKITRKVKGWVAEDIPSLTELSSLVFLR